MIRLEIVTNRGRFNLALKEDTSIRMEHNSPLFQTDVIPGSRTYNFAIPFNDINRIALEFPEKIMYNGRIRIYSCNYYFHNYLFNGKLAILRVNSEYQAQFIDGTFAFDEKTSNISEILDENYYFAYLIDIANSIIQKSYPNVTVQFPEIYNDKFYDGAELENTQYEFMMNQFDSDNNTFKENTYDVINDINKNNNTMVPQPYLFHVIVKLIEKLDYELVGDFKRDDRIKKLLIYNNYPLDKFYSSGYPGLNIFNGFFNLNQIVPEITVSDFINAIKDFFSVGVFFNANTKKLLMIYKKTILNSEGYFDIDPYTPDKNEITFSEKGGYEFALNFENNSRADIIKADLSKENVIEVDTFLDLITHHGDVDNIYYLKNTAQYLQSKDSPSAVQWTRLSEKYYSIKKGEKKLNIKTLIGPILSSTLRGAGYHGVVPSIRETGSSIPFGCGKNDPGFKLMIWHGIYKDFDNKLYPFASSLNIDNFGNKIADFTLLPDGDEGIFNIYQKEWLEFQSDADIVRVVAKLPIEFYLSLLEVFSAEENAKRKIRYRGINFIPEKISAFHKMNSNLVEAEFIMHKKSSLPVKEETNNENFIDVFPSSFSFDQTLHTNEVAQVKSLSPWIATLQTGVEWIILLKFSANGNGILEFTIAYNPTTTPRSAIITIDNGVSTREVLISQQASTVTSEILDLDTQSIITPDNAAKIYNINLTSNVSWYFDTITYGWLTVTPTSGSGNASIEIRLQSNPDLLPRQAILYIHGVDLTTYIVITQKGTS